MSQTLSSPELVSLEPNTAEAGSGEFVLAVKGLGFTMHSQVFYDGVGQATGMLGQDLLSSPMNPRLWFEPGTISVTVMTGDHVAGPVSFTLTEPVSADQQSKEAVVPEDDASLMEQGNGEIIEID